MKKLVKFSTAGLLLSAVQAANAEITVSVQNITQGLYFTPVLSVAHSADNSLFEVGESASTEIQAMAEGGDLSGLATVGDSISANYANTQGLTAPGQMQMVTIDNTATNTVLSIVGMILPSNDGFIGLDNWTIPSEAGTYTIYVNAYDAGTEANDEVRGSGAPGMAGMPVPPPLDPLLGSGGTGVTSQETNDKIHIHRGNIGDDDMTAGTSDVSNQVHRWLNPVAKVTVVVK